MSNASASVSDQSDRVLEPPEPIRAALGSPLGPHVARLSPCKWVRAEHLQMCKLGSEARRGEMGRDEL